MKPIAIFKLTPAQIALVDRLAESENGVVMDVLDYQEIVAYQEVAKLSLADMQTARGRKVRIVLTAAGAQVRANGYISKKPILRLTGPQINVLRFLASGRRKLDQMPSTMIDVCRRMMLRGWAKWEGDDAGTFRASLTAEGRQILLLLDVGNDNA